MRVSGRRGSGLPFLAVIGALAAGLMAGSLALARPAGASIDFLHIEANEGGSSGGHVALRLGDTIWHFRNEGGLLLLARADSQRFLRDYALLENRPIHVRRIEVEDAAAQAVHERFRARLEAQRSQQQAFAEARAERLLLEALRSQARGADLGVEGALAVAGAGYFAPPGGVPAADTALLALRRAVVQQRGAGFFARRRATLYREMGDLEPPLDLGRRAPLSLDAAAPYEYGFAARYRDLAAGLVALEILENARALRDDAIRTAEGPALRLAPDERQTLEELSARLHASALRLLEGARPDWGPALLVAMARLAAVDASLRDGRLHVLDAYPDAAPTLEPRVLEHGRALLPAVASESEGVARETIRALVRRRGSQAAWADVEDATNRHLEILGAWREGQPLRAWPERLVPTRSAALRALVPLRLPARTLDRALPIARDHERWLDTEILRLRGYDLITRNCVSELFATLNAAFPDPERATAALGGVVDGRSGLAFIPFVSAEHVTQRYRLQRVFTIPSLRHARRDRIRAEEGLSWGWLREASPLTARTTRPGASDSFFVFFTDGAVWVRPLFGVVNVAAGAGETALGLLRAPLDRGQMLLRGLRGTLMSLPELGFVNLRKGTHDWVPRDAWLELGLDLAASNAAPPAPRCATPRRASRCAGSTGIP